MYFILGIITCIAAPVAGLIVAFIGADWETGLGGHPVASIAILLIGWLIAGVLFFLQFSQ